MGTASSAITTDTPNSSLLRGKVKAVISCGSLLVVGAC